jgi:hypothetical protein
MNEIFEELSRHIQNGHKCIAFINPNWNDICKCGYERVVQSAGSGKVEAPVPIKRWPSWSPKRTLILV